MMRSFGTHDGAFHADEVTACALLILFDFIDDDKVYRTRDPETLARCEFVCDVGGLYDPSVKRFDHHQADYQGPLSSAGMILNYLESEGTLSSKEANHFQEELVAGIDAHDNGQLPQYPGVCTFSHVVANFMPVRRNVDDATLDRAFKEALHFVLDHLKRLWKRYQYIQECARIVEKKMEEQSEVLIFDEDIPWLESFFALGGEDHPALFVVMPARGHWKLRGVPPSYEDRMSVRIPLPEEWAGLLEKDLKKVSEISGGIFCHKQRFISIWQTKEDALKALEYVLTQGKGK